MSESPPFVVVRFLSDEDDEDEYYEVALSKWLQDLDENMIGNLLWPEDNSIAGTLVRTEAKAQSNWPIYTVEVKRYYDTYFQARKGLKGIIEYASAYETDTEKEMGRGKRKKKVKRIEFSDESDNDQHVRNQCKKKKSSIPSPPAVNVPTSPIKVDTLPPTQEENDPLSFEGKLDSPRNLLDVLSVSDFDERLTTLEKKLEDISRKLDVVIMNQANLNRGLHPEQTSVINRPANLPPLPLSNIESLEEFEKFISKDANLSAACYYLKTLALGNNEKTAASKLMTKLMTNSLAIHFNFDGHNRHNPKSTTKIKRPFKELKLWELFQGVMLLKFPTSDLSEALNAVRNWLRNAAGRKHD